jgi:hypothetical protein
VQADITDRSEAEVAVQQTEVLAAEDIADSVAYMVPSPFAAGGGRDGGSTEGPADP